MSRYAGDHASSNNRAAAANGYEAAAAETPLPTYEEVVNPNHVHIGFKTDVLLPPASSSSSNQGQSCVEGGAPNRENDAARRRTTSCKPNRTGTILVLLGMILIPLCGMIIILQLKVCATEQSQLQQSIDKINASYIECTIDLTSVQENLDSNENRIRDLNYQVEQLTLQKRKLEQMLYSTKNDI